MSPKVSETYTKEKRNTLLTLATGVFVEKGFEKATMQDLVEACQVSRGGLYRYFASTEEVFLEILNEISLQDQASLSSRIEANNSAEDIMMSFFNEQVEALVNIEKTLIPAVYEYAIGRRQSEAGKEWLRRRREASLSYLMEVFTHGVLQGEFLKQSPEELSEQTLVFLEGLILTAMATNQEEAYYRKRLDFLLNSFRSK